MYFLEKNEVYSARTYKNHKSNLTPNKLNVT